MTNDKCRVCIGVGPHYAEAPSGKRMDVGRVGVENKYSPNVSCELKAYGYCCNNRGGGLCDR